MIKRLFLFVLVCVMHTAMYAQTNTQSKAQMVFSNDFHDASGQLGNLTAHFITEKTWTDMNGEIGAIVRIKVTGMSVSEMSKLKVIGSANASVHDTQFLENEQEWIVPLSKGTNMWLEMSHPTYGKSTRLSLPKLKEKGMYDVTLVNNRTTTIVVHSLPDGADVYLDGNHHGKTPCEISEQRFGKHDLKLMYGSKTKEVKIDVEEGHTFFDDFDFRERRNINIISSEDNTTIYIDNQLIGQAPIHNYEVLVGPHTFKAIRTGSKGYNDTQIDEQTIDISSQTEIKLYPIKKGNVQVLTRYAGKPVYAELVVDNKDKYTSEPSYKVNLPYGTHSFRVSYNGKSKEKFINVNKPEQTQVFKLSAKNDVVWPWQREYDIAPVGFSLAYVYKQLVTTGEGQKLKESGVWPDGKGKTLKGMQAGLHFQPCFKFGLGLYTGLFYELYVSTSKKYDYDMFIEHCAYVPVHLYYRIPFGRKVALSVHGGLGFNYVIHGAYSAKDEDIEDYTDFYEEDGFPKKFNMAMEVGAGLRLGAFQLNFQYGKGLNDHKSYSSQGDFKTIQNKYTFGVSYMFSAE